MPVKDKDLLKLLKQNGWTEVRIHGSHHILRKGDKTETVPVHGKDVPTGLLEAILKRTGLK
jgi:predicted RNA binding protein YcfA (HicA-like mRNA interferase family)